jgi:hypothetical protein
VGWTLVGTGVVAAGAAAYLAWRAASIDDELSGKRRVVWDEALMQRHDQGERDALWARISAAGAVLLGGGGVAVLVLSRPGPEPGSPVALLGWSGGF